MSAEPELWMRICNESSPDQLSFRALLAVLDRSERRDDPQFTLELQQLLRDWPSFARSISEHLTLIESNAGTFLPHLPGLDLLSELQIDHYTEARQISSNGFPNRVCRVSGGSPFKAMRTKYQWNFRPHCGLGN